MGAIQWVTKKANNKIMNDSLKKRNIVKVFGISPVAPVAKTLPSNVWEVQVCDPWKLRSLCLCGQKSKT